MVNKRQKRLERMRQNPNNVSLNDFRRVLEDHGFVYQRTSGSHFTFYYILAGQTKLFVVPFNRPIKPIYVKRALKIIDEIIEEQGEDESDELDE